MLEVVVVVSKYATAGRVYAAVVDCAAVVVGVE